MESESESYDRRLQMALRCANAAHLLYSLKRSIRCSGSAEEHEAVELEDVVMRLRVDLVRERMRMRRVKLCGVMEMLLQVCPQCRAKFSSMTTLVEHVQKVNETNCGRAGVKKVTIDA